MSGTGPSRAVAGSSSVGSADTPTRNVSPHAGSKTGPRTTSAAERSAKTTSRRMTLLYDGNRRRRADEKFDTVRRESASDALTLDRADHVGDVRAAGRPPRANVPDG